MGALNDLWRGEITPQERHIKQDDKRKTLSERVHTSARAFRETLSDEQRALFDRYEAAIAEARSVDDEASFVDAFTLGARMMLEVMIGGDVT